MKSSPPEIARDRPILAIIFRLFAAMTVALSFVIVKLAGSLHIGIPQVMFWRFIVCTVCLFAYLAIRRDLGILRTRRPVSHFGRGLNSTIIMALNYWAAMVIPIALVSTINFTAPLFAVLITSLVLRHPVSRVHWVAVLIGFVGVVLVSMPSPHDDYPLLGALAALAGSAGTSVSNLQVRDLSRTEQPLAIAFYFSLIGALLSALALPFSTAPTQPLEWLLLVSLGLQGMAFQVLFALSLR
ncbi:MAG TPA: DMT family transporter, partial [Novosphingobium sp.]|nr:DMT family transporter [Novosphingobium sp.]